MNIPSNLVYAETHEWVRVEGDVAVVGISDHAQAELTDVVYLELPTLGKKVEFRTPVATVESVKAVSDIYAPVSGEIVEVNSDLPNHPDKINTEPYESWIFKIRFKNSDEIKSLKSADEYKQQIGS